MMSWPMSNGKRSGERAAPGFMFRAALAFILCIGAFLPLVSQQADAALPEPVSVSTGKMPNGIAVNEQTNKIYISNSSGNSVTVIDGTTNEVLTTIAVGDSPSAIALDKNRNTIYVANYFDNSVSVIDGATDTLTTTIPVSGGPRRLAVDSSTHTVYVGHYADDVVKLIDGDTQSVVATVPIPGTINAITVNDATYKAYVASSAGIVTVIGADWQTTDVAVGNKPVAIGVNKTTNKIYVVSDKSGNGEVKVIDGAADAVTATLNTENGPTAVAVNEETNAVYVTNQGSASLTVIDGATNDVSVVSLAAGSGPIAAAVDPGTNRIYIAHNSGYTMSIVDGSTLAVSAADTESASQIIAVNAGTHKVYLLNAAGNKVAVFYTLEDTTPPAVAFQENGNPSPASFASSIVSVTDTESGVQENWLTYAWSQSETEPSSGYWGFVNGSELYMNVDNPNGVYYLYIKAVDRAGNSTTVRSNSFLLDSTGPSVNVKMTKSDHDPYPDNTWTNQDVSVSVEATDASSVTEVTYSLDSGSTWNAYSDPLVFKEEGVHSVRIKAADSLGNETVEPSAIMVKIDKTMPVIALLGPPSLHLTVGGMYMEEGATATDAGGSGVAEAVEVSGSVDSDVPGTYTLRYNVFDLAGNAAEEVARTVVVDAKNSPPSSAGDSPPVVAKSVIDLNGNTLDPDTIDTSKPSVTFEVTPKSGVAYVSIPASILANLADKNAAFSIEIRTSYGSYRIPLDLATLIPGLKDLLADNGLQAEEISFKITLTDKSGDEGLQAALANGLPDGKVLGAIVDYRLEIVNTMTGQTIGTAEQFSKALTRLIPMPRNVVSMPAQWGAFRYNDKAKKFEFVPARAVQMDGVWYAMISSYSNSVYVVADNAASFKDVRRHWSQSFVELAAAKGLVAGVGGGRYDPDTAVTRAEFAAMLVRALGRAGSTVNSAASFDDVNPDAWYSRAVATAKELGLLDFTDGKRFRPDQPLTREEMAGMLAAAIRLEQPSAAGEAANLDGYKDIGSVDASYLEDVRLMVKLQIMKGTGEDTFSPKGATTRAQAAVVFIRALQELGMID